MLATPIALITGASRGLGRAVADKLAREGFRVLLVGRKAVELDLAAAELIAHGRSAHTFVADVNNPADVAALANWVQQEFGQLDVLVNNAGVFLEPHDFSNPAGGSALAVDPDDVLATFAINALAPLRLVQALAPRLSDGARIVNVSSGMGQLADMGGLWPGYRMSKTALNALTRILAAELAPRGIKVNAVCPGWCRTDMGGEGADRTPEQGAASIAWAAMLPDDGPSGGFFRDGQALEW